MFYVIDKYNETVNYFHEAKQVSAWLLGRNLNRYVIVKTEDGVEDKLYKFTTGDCFAIEKELEAL